MSIWVDRVWNEDITRTYNKRKRKKEAIHVDLCPHELKDDWNGTFYFAMELKMHANKIEQDKADDMHLWWL